MSEFVRLKRVGLLASRGEFFKGEAFLGDLLAVAGAIMAPLRDYWQKAP